MLITVCIRLDEIVLESIRADLILLLCSQFSEVRILFQITLHVVVPIVFQGAKDSYTSKVQRDGLLADRAIVIEKLTKEGGQLDEQIINKETTEYSSKKKDRIDNLFQHVQSKRLQYLQNLLQQPYS